MEKSSPQSEPTEKEYSWQGRQFSQEVVTISDKGLRSKGLIVEPSETAHFEVFSDEGARLGGENSAPRPLNYFLLSVGFCALTQLHRYGEMLKVDIKNAKVTVRSGFRTDGSVLRGTIQASTVDFAVDFDIESDDTPENVSKCIEAAEAGCFVMQTIQNPTKINRNVTLNGKRLDKVD
tara:strand:- start:1113 stop:1646 length:534 start_codon:yes stop_codon:yes gene_type:complete